MSLKLVNELVKIFEANKFDFVNANLKQLQDWVVRTQFIKRRKIFYEELVEEGELKLKVVDHISEKSPNKKLNVDIDPFLISMKELKNLITEFLELISLFPTNKIDRLRKMSEQQRAVFCKRNQFYEMIHLTKKENPEKIQDDKLQKTDKKLGKQIQKAIKTGIKTSGTTTIAHQKLEFDKEKFQKELELKERQLDLKEAESARRREIDDEKVSDASRDRELELTKKLGELNKQLLIAQSEIEKINISNKSEAIEKIRQLEQDIATHATQVSSINISNQTKSLKQISDLTKELRTSQNEIDKVNREHFAKGQVAVLEMQKLSSEVERLKSEQVTKSKIQDMMQDSLDQNRGLFLDAEKERMEALRKGFQFERDSYDLKLRGLQQNLEKTGEDNEFLKKRHQAELQQQEINLKNEYQQGELKRLQSQVQAGELSTVRQAQEALKSDPSYMPDGILKDWVQGRDWTDVEPALDFQGMEDIPGPLETLGDPLMRHFSSHISQEKSYDSDIKTIYADIKKAELLTRLFEQQGKMFISQKHMLEAKNSRPIEARTQYSDVNLSNDQLQEIRGSLNEKIAQNKILSQDELTDIQYLNTQLLEQSAVIKDFNILQGLEKQQDDPTKRTLNLSYMYTQNPVTGRREEIDLEELYRRTGDPIVKQALIEQMKVDAEDMKQEMENQMQAEAQPMSLDDKAQELVNKLQSEKRNLESQLQDLQKRPKISEYKSIQEELSLLKAKPVPMDEDSSRISELEGQLAEKIKQIATQAPELHKLNSQIKGLSDQVSQKNREIATVSQQLQTEKSRSSQEIQRIRTEAETRVGESKQTTEKLQREIEGHQKQLSDLTDKFQQSTRFGTTQFSENQTQRQQYENDKRELQRKLKDLKRRHELLHETLGEERQTKQREDRGSVSRINMLQRNVTQLMSERDAIQSEKNQLERSVLSTISILPEEDKSGNLQNSIAQLDKLKTFVTTQLAVEASVDDILEQSIKQILHGDMTPVTRQVVSKLDKDVQDLLDFSKIGKASPIPVSQTTQVPEQKFQAVTTELRKSAKQVQEEIQKTKSKELEIQKRQREGALGIPEQYIEKSGAVKTSGVKRGQKRRIPELKSKLKGSPIKSRPKKKKVEIVSLTGQQKGEFSFEMQRRFHKLNKNSINQYVMQNVHVEADKSNVITFLSDETRRLEKSLQKSKLPDSPQKPTKQTGGKGGLFVL